MWVWPLQGRCALALYSTGHAQSWSGHTTDQLVADAHAPVLVVYLETQEMMSVHLLGSELPYLLFVLILVFEGEWSIEDQKLHDVRHCVDQLNSQRVIDLGSLYLDDP